MNSNIIDPHFDQIPPDELTEDEKQARRDAIPRRGLSINDTIAHDADHSVGASGVQTSNVEDGPSLDDDLHETLDKLSDQARLKK
jgi:hypothetical protein